MTKETAKSIAKYSATTKVIGIGTFILLITLLITYNRGKNQGKKEEETKVVPVPLPTVDLEKGVTEDVAKRVRAYALSLHEDLIEIFGMRDVDLYKRLTSENDTVLVSVYNDFNNLYVNEEKGSLTKWLQDEIVQPNAMKAFIERSLNLNLK
ncbi:hypothetical protein JJL45_09155 [Tamlana sp. s12]|uniref:hypothetical protein n=1 Tax=Tamlana sp. s12 TaxID=1630406 RepID=UPI0008006CAD|nr:hypothetical protein [Tamlana sp. s12]OBQ52876.1 hypothetical protein VQ01_13085 [Tamlana sp. s12]QQY81097.1 hypothetical protein JJL45_09155 [Tamlana sp. s12]